MRKFISFIATSAILLNSVLAPMSVLAQEASVTPEPTPEATSTPEETIAPTSEPTLVPSEIPTDLPTSTPEIVPITTESASPTPTETSQSIETQAPESNPTTTSPPESPTSEASSTSTPVFTPVETDKNAQVTTQIIVTDLIPQTLQQNSVIKLITDKLDYSPSEIAIISGSGFIPEKTYSLTVSSADNPATSTTANVTANGGGEFTYEYQLDGKPRLNYSVNIKDGEELIALTSFTDSDFPYSCTGQCVSDDVKVQSITLTDSSGSPLTCGINESSKEAYAKITYSSNATRYAVYIQGTLKVNGVEISTIDSMGTCVDQFTGSIEKLYKVGIVSCGAIVSIDDLVLSWNEKGSGNTCASIFESKKCASPKCYGSTSEVIVNSPPSLKLVKEFGTDVGVASDWTLGASGPSSFSGNPSSGSDYITAVVLAGTYSLSESGPSTNYSASDWSCVINDGAPVLGNSVTLANNDKAVCTITNTWKNNASITIVKDAQPDSSQDFAYTTTGAGLSNFSLDDDANTPLPNTKTFSNLAAGTYTVTEGTVTGWDLSNLTCVDPTSNSTVSGSIATINLAQGESVTCTYTNTMRGAIGGHKYNDLDGSLTTTGDQVGLPGWTIELYQNDQLKGSTTTASDGTFGFSSLAPGNYKLKEVLQNGWTPLYPSPAGDGFINVTLTPGENDFSNNFINTQFASVTIYKDVDTDGDGDIDITHSTAWFWNKDGSGHYPTGNIMSNLAPGTYTFSEEHQTGFHVTSLICNNGPTGTPNNYGAVESQSIAVSSGQNLVCTFTNTKDTGTLRVVKVLSNDNGGTLDEINFSFEINNDGTTRYFEADGTNDYQVPIGKYSVVENPTTGYSTSYSNCSDVEVVSGQITTCTITNDDIAPSLILNKIVSNSSGGDEDESDWTLIARNATGGIALQGPGIKNYTNDVVSGPTFQAGTYTLEESGPSGYTPSAWTCTGILINPGNQITLGVGQSTICTITNSDVAPTITLNKFVDINYGGIATPSSFTLTIDGSGVTQGYANQVLANKAYTINELGLTGYKFNRITGDTLCPSVLGGTITLSEGQKITCNIYNEDLPATLIVKKVVVNNNGGTKKANEFTFSVNGGDAVAFTQSTDELHGENKFDTLSKGTYSVTETPSVGYSISYDNCNNLSISNGETKTCTITNTRDVGTITIVKNALGGNDTFGFIITGETGSTQTINTANGNSVGPITVATGPYSVSEASVPAGWDDTSVSCKNEAGKEVTTNFSVETGKNITCTFTNTKYSSIQGKKFEDLNGNGNWNSGEPFLNGWTIHLFDSQWNQKDVKNTGHTGIEGQYRFENLMPGTYYLCEDLKTGWKQTYPSSGQTKDNSYCRTETVNAGDNLTGKHFGNFELTYIQGRKFNDLNANGLDDTEPLINDWTIRLYDSAWNQVGNDQLTHNIPGNGDGRYRFENLFKGTYYICEVMKDGWTQTYPGSTEGVENESQALNEAPRCQTATISTSGTPVTGKIFGNVELSDIHGYKFNDLDGDGVEDQDEPKLSGWKIFIDKDGDQLWDSGEQFMLTDSSLDHFGWFWFLGLIPGTYSICEEAQSGWSQTTSPTCHRLQLPYRNGENTCGENMKNRTSEYVPACNFGNQEDKFEVAIEKSNDKSGGTSAGNTVSYTLKVTNNGNRSIYNLDVKDFLPGGFSYIVGTTTGDTTDDPAVSGGTLIWEDVDNEFTPGETFTINYQAKIASDTSDGIYKNYATCTGNIRSEKESIECDPADSSVTVGSTLGYSGSLTGQVLGISTSVLPVTGNQTWILIAAFASIALGIFLNLYARKEYKKKNDQK